MRDLCCCCWRGSPARRRSARLHLGRVRSCFSHRAPSTHSCLQGLPPARQRFSLLRSPQRATQNSKLCLVKRCPVFLSHFNNIPVVWCTIIRRGKRRTAGVRVRSSDLKYCLQMKQKEFASTPVLIALRCIKIYLRCLRGLTLVYFSWIFK